MDFRNCSNNTVWGPEARTATGPESRLLGWNVPPEYIPYIPTHWLQGYPEPAPFYNYCLGLLYCFFFFFACIGNGIVIWIFISAKTLRTPSNMLVVNLALCDFIMMLKTPIFIYNSFNLGFALGPLGCQIFGFAGSISGIGASATNAAIAYDRYMTIARPFDGKVTKGKAFILIMMIWAYVAPWALFPLLQVWGRFVPEGYLTSCTFDYLTDSDNIRIFVAVMFIICYVIPMSLIIYFYYQIVGHVFRHEKTLREQAKKMNVESLRSGQTNQQSAEIRIAKTAISLCFLFVLSWTPYGVLALIGAFGDKKLMLVQTALSTVSGITYLVLPLPVRVMVDNHITDAYVGLPTLMVLTSLLTPGITMIPACTCKLVACIDPYVYAISHPRYRLELQKRVPCLGINEPPPASETATATTEATNA